MFDRNESVNVTRKFLIALGMELQPSTNTLVDQETKSPIYFEGKIVKANNDPDKALYISDYDVKLDPLDPKCTKIVERLFGKFLDDNSSPDMQNIPEVLAYFFDKNEEDMHKTFNKMHDVYLNIFKRIGINIIPVVSDGGTMGGRYPCIWSKSHYWL